MRLWSVHPCYLDPAGLVALWREGLLALAVLRGATQGYRNHPQLTRFRRASSPTMAVKCYLWHVFLEARARGYRFDRSKLGRVSRCAPIPVTRGQLRYELAHLREKLRRRSPQRYQSILRLKAPLPHPMFVTVAGPIETWEKRLGSSQVEGRRTRPYKSPRMTISARPQARE